MTGWQDAEGLVHFREDIYGLDTPQGIVTSTLQPRRPRPATQALASDAKPLAVPPKPPMVRPRPAPAATP
jgi:hypothetical protein